MGLIARKREMLCGRRGAGGKGFRRGMLPFIIPCTYLFPPAAKERKSTDVLRLCTAVGFWSLNDEALRFKLLGVTCLLLSHRLLFKRESMSGLDAAMGSMDLAGEGSPGAGAGGVSLHSKLHRAGCAAARAFA